MGFKLAEAFVEIGVRKQQLVAGLASGNRAVEGWVAKQRKNLDAVRSMAAKVFLPLAGGGGLLLKLASDAEEAESKFKAVFKEQTESAHKFSVQLAKDTNRSSLAIRDFMSGMQGLFVPLGFTRKEGEKMSGMLTQLGIDLASFHNVSEEASIDALKGGLIGNHEALKKFAIPLTQATLDLKLLEMGFQKSTDGATEQQKVMARLAIIMEATKDAQGDAVRTSDSFANSWKGVIGRGREMLTMFGNELLPVGKQLIDWASGVVEWFKAMDENQKGVIVRLGVLVAGISAALVVLPTLVTGIAAVSTAAAFLAANPIVLLLGLLPILAISVQQAATDWDNWGKKVASVAAALTGVSNAVTKLDSEMKFEDKARAVNNKIDSKIQATEGTGKHAKAIRESLQDLDALDFDAINEGGSSGGTQISLNALKRKKLVGMLGEADRLAVISDAGDKRNAEIDARIAQSNKTGKARGKLAKFGMDRSEAASVVGNMLFSGPAAAIKAMNDSSRESEQKAKEEAEKKAAKEKAQAEKDKAAEEKQRDRDKDARRGFREMGFGQEAGAQLVSKIFEGGMPAFLKAVEQNRTDKDRDFGTHSLTDINKRLQKGTLENDEKRDRKKTVKALETMATDGVKVKNFKDWSLEARFGA